MQENEKPILQHNPDFIILHVSTNDALSLPSSEIPDKILHHNFMSKNLS